MTAQPIGERLDALGIRGTFDEGDLICSAVVIMAVMPAGSDSPLLKMVYSEGMSWIERYGMLHASASQETADISSETVPREET